MSVDPAKTPRTEMICLRCHCFSSTQYCYRCSMEMAKIKSPAELTLERDNAQLRAELAAAKSDTDALRRDAERFEG